LLCCMDTRLHRSRPPNVVLMQREAVETLALMPQMQMQVLCSSAKYKYSYAMRRAGSC